MSKWEMVRLGDYVEQIRGVSYKPKDVSDMEDDEHIPLLRAHNIQPEGLNFKDLVFVNKNRVKNPQYIKKGDIVVCASSGSKELVGKAAQAAQDMNTAFGAFCKVVRPKNKINSIFLKHYFSSPSYKYAILEVSAGANIYNLRNEHIDNLIVPFPPICIQSKIADTLDRASDLIEKRKRQIERLDLLIKSQFIEMFGDPILNPKGWEKCPLADCCTINPSKRELSLIDTNTPVSYIGMADVSENGVINSTNSITLADAKDGLTFFAENDVLFAKITPCMENGKGAIARNLINGIGLGSTEFHVLRPIPSVSNSEWIYYLTSLNSTFSGP